MVFQRDVRVPCPFSWARLLSGELEVPSLGGVAEIKGLDAAHVIGSWLWTGKTGRAEGPQDQKGVVCV